MVSIIVPIYNTAEYLPACLDSICRQTYIHLQIVLVDDQSTDSSAQICDEYAQKDKRIIVIHQKNKGVSGARNTGIRNATGEYIMFVDSDDELYDNSVELLLNDAIKFDADVIAARKKIVNKKDDYKKNNEDTKILIYSGYEALLLSLNGDRETNSACAKLFKTDFINGCYFEEGKNINEDGFFVFQCYLKKPILVYDNVFVYKYNNRENSNSKNLFSDKFFSMIYFCNQKKEIIEKMYPQYIEHSYNMEVRTHLQFLQVLCRTNDKKYKNTHKDSVKIIRKLYKFHKPINKHHKKLAWIVALGFYPIYKKIIRLKYYR